jgi:hypothetical protein
MINLIKDGVTQVVQNYLGVNYQPLSFVHDVEKNSFNKSNKRYGIKVLGASSVDGSLGGITLDHTFELVLTDSFNSPANQLNDSVKSQRAIELQQKAVELAKEIQKQRSVISPNIMIINGLQLSECEYLEEDKIAVQKFQINVKYKI